MQPDASTAQRDGVKCVILLSTHENSSDLGSGFVGRGEVRGKLRLLHDYGACTMYSTENTLSRSSAVS